MPGATVAQTKGIPLIVPDAVQRWLCLRRLSSVRGELPRREDVTRHYARNEAAMASSLLLCVCAATLATLHAADLGQLFVRSPASVVAPLGDEVSFTCVLRSVAERIRWKHDGRFLQAGPDKGGNRSGYHFTLVDASQAGNYQCVAWFGVAALTSKPARLSVVELQNFPPARAAVTHRVPEGNTVALRCDPPRSEPRAKVHFLHNDTNIPSTAATESGLLVLPKVRTYQSGTYRCEATNSIKLLSVRSPKVVHLQVVKDSAPSPPRFLEPPPTDYVVRAGGNVTLECAAVGFPPPTTVWEFLGGEMNPARVTEVPGGLLVTGADPGDEGSYRCLLENGDGSLSLLVSLHVHEPPELVLPPPETVRVLEGEDALMECNFKGKPAPHVSWVFNGEPVVNDSHVTVSGGRLHVKEANRKHAGIFQCFGTNELGSSFGLVTLHVALHQVEGNDEPAAPAGQLDPGSSGLPPAQQVPGDWGKRQGGKAAGRKERRPHHAKMTPPSRPLVTQLGDSSVMVRWKVPPNDGLPIQFFKVQYSLQGRGHRGGSSWMTTNEDIPPYIRSYEVDGLRPNHTYKFRIAAAYSNDDNKLSPNSPRFHLQPDDGESQPLAPKLFRTEAVAPTVIRIYWQYDDDLDVKPEGFYVYYRAATTAGDYFHLTVERQHHRTFDIDHLLPDTVYEVKLQAFTVTSASQFSAILTQKTLPLPTTEAPQATTDPTDPLVVPSPLDNSGGAGQLYLAVGCGVGALALLVLSAATCWLLYRRHQSNAQNGQGGEHQDKFLDPSLQIEAVNSLTRASKSRQQNGQPVQPLQNGKINITSNPLAEVESQGLLETPHGQNNNCEQQDQQGAGDVSVPAWRQQPVSASQENYV